MLQGSEASDPRYSRQSFTCSCVYKARGCEPAAMRIMTPGAVQLNMTSATSISDLRAERGDEPKHGRWRRMHLSNRYMGR